MTVDPSARTEAGGSAEAAVGLLPGASIGKYRLDRELGAGGMGVVWAAFDPDLERPVAIKVLRAVDSAAALRTRLLREARAMARLKHVNILTVYEVGTDRNRDYIAMELIDGSDLDRWLASRPPRPQIFAALFAAGRGLAAAHDAGLIHRDLKPHNILRGRDGGVYVTDFGLARGQIEDGPELVQGGAAHGVVGSQPRALDSVLDSPLTQTGVLIGTPAYMAPEQFAGRAPDPRSDQFAFCVTAWEALTGARPFAGKTLEELRAAASAGPAAIAQVAEAVLPLRVRGVLARGLAPDPAARWPDMDSLLRSLEAAIAPPRRSRWPAITAIALAVVGFLTGVALYTRSHTAPAASPPGPGSGSGASTIVLTIPSPPAIPDVPAVPKVPNAPEERDAPDVQEDREDRDGPDVPDVPEVPDVRVPNGAGPNGAGPNGRVPNVRVPNVRVPNVRVPNVRVPGVRVPDVRVPNGAGPNGPGPNVSGPNVSGPNLRGPRVRGPHAWDPPAPEPPAPPAPPAPPPHGEHDSAERSHGAAGKCGSAVDAFGAAWSAERRAAVTARHRGNRELLAVAALLDSARRDWISAYEAACAQPASEAREERLECLRDARDEVNEATQELATSDDDVVLVGVIPINAAIAACKR